MRTKCQKDFKSNTQEAIIHRNNSNNTNITKFCNNWPWNVSFHYKRSQTPSLKLHPIFTLKCNQVFETVITTSVPKRQFTKP